MRRWCCSVLLTAGLAAAGCGGGSASGPPKPGDAPQGGKELPADGFQDRSIGGDKAKRPGQPKPGTVETPRAAAGDKPAAKKQIE